MGFDGVILVPFLSTPSARRATPDFQPGTECPVISIHALREEGDTSCHTYTLCDNYFYPRPPRGGRPSPNDFLTKLFEISIHALREEGDEAAKSLSASPLDISIHALREEGDPRQIFHRAVGELISIHALREEGDGRCWMLYPTDEISIHALREEGDPTA